MAASRRRHVLAAGAVLGGLALFAYSVREAGGREIVEGVAGLGWGLLPILALAGIRFVLRAEAWRLCTPVSSRLKLRQTFMAFLSGDAIGNLTPLGLFASEPTKVLLIRHHLATRESVSSLAIDNLVYAFSVAAMISAGLIVMLMTVPLTFEAREGTIGALAALGVLCVVAIRLLRRRRSAAPVQGSSIRDRLRRVRHSIAEFFAGDKTRLWRVFALNVTFHVVAVLEVYLTLHWLMGDRAPTLAEAMMFESLNRVITAAFKFVPLRVGVDEAASGAFAGLIGINPVAGVTLAVVRKVRSLFWVGVGLAIIAIHHAGEAPARDHHESVPAPRA
jgi:hypothetical protein